MIPNQSLSALLLVAPWLPPDDKDNEYLLDYEMGGIGLNDPSAGLRVQVWTLQLFGNDVVISAPGWSPTILFTRTLITELSLAFDQNMNPFVAFVENGAAKFWWFDTVAQTTVFTNLPAGSITPRCCLDDKRETQTTSSDIILAYMNGGDLFFRAQRDRYLIEYLLKASILGGVRRIGMNKLNRLQIYMQGPIPEGYIG